jgi:hypothetical protein
MTHSLIASRAVRQLLRNGKQKPSEYIAMRKARAAWRATQPPLDLPVIDPSLLPQPQEPKP